MYRSDKIEPTSGLRNEDWAGGRSNLGQRIPIADMSCNYPTSADDGILMDFQHMRFI